MYIPSKAKESIKNLGSQIKLARKRRQWTIAELAQKVGVTSPTIIAVEKGESTVSIGVFISALWTLGMESELAQISNPTDQEGIKLMNARLPKKVKAKKRTMDNDF